MRTALRSTVWALALAICGCNGQGTDLFSPASQTGGDPSGTFIDVAPGSAIAVGGSAQNTVGIFTVDVDLDTLSATATLARSGASSDNTYELPLAPFMKPGGLKIVDVARTPTTVDISYRVEHPIPAPTDLAGPPSAANRADLGAIMRVLFLGDVASATGNTYFAGAGDVIAETSLIANPQGYFTPKGLLTLGSGAIANTFPYRMVVDEAANSGLGNRDGIPGIAGVNGIGNYDPLTGGWQQGNMGANRTGWTGYGMLHQGQSATSTVRLNLASLSTAGSFSFNTAVIAKYIDPRGGATGIERRSNRLPSASGDPTAFSYRMPYGALDCEEVRFAGESGGFVPNAISFSILNFHVRDFDARANETTIPDLGDDPNVNLVQIGGSGAPTLTVDIPGILDTPITFDAADQLDDDTAYSGDVTLDSGMPGDELFFSRTIAKAAGIGQTSTFYTGMLKVADPEAIDPNRSSYYFAVDGTLAPLSPALTPEPVTYQAFRVLVSTPNAQPNATASFVGGASVIASGGTTEVQIDSYTDVESNPATVTVDYDFDGVFFTDVLPVNITPAGPFPTAMGISPQIFNLISANPIDVTTQVRYNDGFHPDDMINLTLTIGGNNLPTADVQFVSPTAVIGTIIQLTIANEADVEGDPVRYDIDWEWDGVAANFVPDFPWVDLPSTFAQLPKPAPAAVGPYTAGIRIKDALHPAGTLMGVPYNVVATNTQANCRFIIPANVLSATTIPLTVDAYDDPDGDPVQLRIDWNGDFDFNDAGESGLPAVTAVGQIYTSPLQLNNLSATPRPAVTVNVEYTDNVSPHSPVFDNAGQFILGGNRPPVITGSPSLQLTPIPSGGTFRVLQNGATASDPEGNGISYTLRSVPNSGAATNLTYANFTAMLSPIFLNPPVSSVAMTVYANDALHGTTAGTLYPTTLNGTICANLLQQWTFDGSDQGWTPGESFVPSLANTDAIGWSAFQRCVQQGNGMVGDMWTTGPDTGMGCTFRINDYGNNLDNNVVSPAFSLAGMTKANAVFNSSKTGRLVSCRYRVYVSITGGTSWVQLYNTVRVGAVSGTQNESNVVINLDAYVGQPNVRLRFRMDDTAVTSFGAAPYAGWSFDNVRVFGCP